MKNKIKWQLRNFFLFFRALALIARFGSRRDIPARIKIIAVVQGAKLGDMVCTTPIFQAIKNNSSEIKIVVVGDSVNEKLLAGHPAVSKYIVWNKNFTEAARALREERIDYGVVILPSMESLALLICGGARAAVVPKIVGGLCPFETRLYKLLRKFAISVPHYWGGYAPREYLRLLEPINIKSVDTKKWLTFLNSSSTRIEQFFTAHNLNKDKDFLVGITPAVGGNPRKRFAPEKFAAVADYLVEKYGARIIIIGAGKDKDDIERMCEFIKSKNKIINTLNQFSIDEIKALISSLSLFISADTGPIYIAEAFGTPTIDIVGPMDENAQPPRGELHKVVVPPREKPAFNLLNHDGSNPEEELRQANATTVEMVKKVIDELVPLIFQQQHNIHLS